MCFLLVPASDSQQSNIQKHQFITSREEFFHILLLSMTNSHFFLFISFPVSLASAVCPRDLCGENLLSPLIPSPLTSCFAGAKSLSLLAAETKQCLYNKVPKCPRSSTLPAILHLLLIRLPSQAPYMGLAEDPQAALRSEAKKEHMQGTWLLS